MRGELFLLRHLLYTHPRQRRHGKAWRLRPLDYRVLHALTVAGLLLARLVYTPVRLRKAKRAARDQGERMVLTRLSCDPQDLTAWDHP